MEPTDEDCLVYFEQIRWGQHPQCPYCSSLNNTPIEKEKRYHCNTCFNSYSVTVGTMFHRTHIPLRKWFMAIFLLSDTEIRPSIRQLARAIGVSKNTATSMIKRINSATAEDLQLMQQIKDFVEGWDI